MLTPTLKRLFGAAAVLCGLEAVAIIAYLVTALLDSSFRLLSADLTLVALFLAAAIWVGFNGFKLRTGARWARSGAIFWQTAQLFLASQSFTGRGASWLIGGFLVVTAVIVLGLLFSKPVLAHAKTLV